MMDKMDKRFTTSANRSTKKYTNVHIFADASSKGVWAVVYAVVDQPERKSKGLLISKSKLAKKKLAIPRLKLISTYLATNLLPNAKVTLCKCLIANCYGWSDSTTVLL